MNKGQHIEFEDHLENNSGLYDEVLLEDEESTPGGPNEMMYFGIEKIPFASMLTFEEALQRQKEILDISANVNNIIMPIWDSRKHIKNKFYKNSELTTNETNEYKIIEDFPEFNLKKICEIKGEPKIMSLNLDPSKVRMGSLKSSISFA